MVVIECPIVGCTYSTPDVSEAIGCALLATHTTVHSNTQSTRSQEGVRAPQLDRPKVDMGVNIEEWNIFTRRWNGFVSGSGLNPTNCSSQLFQCAALSLGDALLKSHPNIMSKPTCEVMEAMKSLAVVPVALGVARAELLAMSQQRDEPYRSFAARVRGKAETCCYKVKCSCSLDVDFTDCIVRDVLVAGIYDLEIRRDILGTPLILDKTLNEVVSLVEGREMARNCIPSSNSAISSFKRSQKLESPVTPCETDNKSFTALCAKCKKSFNPFVNSARGWNSKPYRFCQRCH